MQQIVWQSINATKTYQNDKYMKVVCVGDTFVTEEMMNDGVRPYLGDGDSIETFFFGERDKTAMRDIAKAIELDFTDRTREQRLKPYAYCGRVGDFDFYEYDENILATLREHNFPVMPVSEYIDKYDNNPIKEMQS